MLVTMPMSGRAISQSSAIWPRPRIPISTTAISVSSSRRQRVSGSPISLFWLPSATTVRACGEQSAPRMSFVDVFPVEPVTATTLAAERSRTALPSAPRAPTASSATSAAAAPAASASSTKATPPRTATKRSPGPVARESIVTPVTASAPCARVSRPGASCATSSSPSGIMPPRRGAGGRLGQPRGRRTGSSGPQTPGPARAPCRR